MSQKERDTLKLAAKRVVDRWREDNGQEGDELDKAILALSATLYLDDYPDKTPAPDGPRKPLDPEVERTLRAVMDIPDDLLEYILANDPDLKARLKKWLDVAAPCAPPEAPMRWRCKGCGKEVKREDTRVGTIHGGIRHVVMIDPYHDCGPVVEDTGSGGET
jgi:hypothetical protein